MAILKRPRFLRDLAEELTWLNKKAGPDIATSWYHSLISTIGQLERHPFLGRERKDLTPPGIRTWRIKDYPRWLVFYEVDNRGNLILYRVRHGALDLANITIKS